MEAPRITPLTMQSNAVPWSLPLRLNAWTAPGLAQVFARQQPTLDCPDFGVAEAANEANIRR